MNKLEKIKYIREALTRVGDPKIYDELVAEIPASGKANKLQDRLWEVVIDKDTKIDYELAEQYYEKIYPQPAGCTSCRSGNWYMRNLDWYYDDLANVVVKVEANDERHASVSVISVNSALTDETLSNPDSNIDYTIAACSAVDGINDCGLLVSSNVVPYVAGFPKKSDSKPNMISNIVIRYVLDNCVSVDDAIEKLGAYNIWCPNFHSYEVHFMISDPNKTVVIEFYDGEMNILKDTDATFGWSGKKAVMTNFHLKGTTLSSGYYDRFAENGMEDLAAGVERYNIVLKGFNNDITNKDEAKSLIDKVLYEHAYTNSEESSEVDDCFWYTEFVDVYGTNRKTTVEEFHNVVRPDGTTFNLIDTIKELYQNRQRGNTTWTSNHTSVYDIANKTLYLRIDNGESKEYAYSV